MTFIILICFVGENIIGSYNDDDIYMMNVAEHAKPYRLDESLRKKSITSPVSTRELPPLPAGNVNPECESFSKDR